MKKFVAFGIIAVFFAYYDSVEDIDNTPNNVIVNKEVKQPNYGSSKDKTPAYYDNSRYDKDVSHDLNTVEYELFRLVNKYRYENNLSKLTWYNKLNKMSRRHSYYQSVIGNWSHEEDIDIPYFDEESRIGYRGVNVGITYHEASYIGENTTSFRKRNTPYETALAKFNGWKNSPTHNKLMLTKEYYKGACGCKESNIRYGKKRTTQYVFCTLNVIKK